VRAEGNQEYCSQYKKFLTLELRGRKREREGEAVSESTMRGGGRENDTSGFEGSQPVPVCPSRKDNIYNENYFYALKRLQRVSVVVKAICYKPEGCGFETL
jgi:hypothetical protein